MIGDAVKTMIWEDKLRNYSKRKNNFNEGAKKTFATIWDMYTLALKNKIKKLDTYDTMETQRNSPVLMEAVGNVACGRDEHRQPVYFLVQLQTMLLTYYQKTN